MQSTSLVLHPLSQAPGFIPVPRSLLVWIDKNRSASIHGPAPESITPQYGAGGSLCFSMIPRFLNIFKNEGQK